MPPATCTTAAAPHARPLRAVPAAALPGRTCANTAAPPPAPSRSRLRPPRTWSRRPPARPRCPPPRLHVRRLRARLAPHTPGRLGTWGGQSSHPSHLSRMTPQYLSYTSSPLHLHIPHIHAKPDIPQGHSIVGMAACRATVWLQRRSWGTASCAGHRAPPPGAVPALAEPHCLTPFHASVSPARSSRQPPPVGQDASTAEQGGGVMLPRMLRGTALHRGDAMQGPPVLHVSCQPMPILGPSSSARCPLCSLLPIPPH